VARDCGRRQRRGVERDHQRESAVGQLKNEREGRAGGVHRGADHGGGTNHGECANRQSRPEQRTAEWHVVDRGEPCPAWSRGLERARIPKRIHIKKSPNSPVATPVSATIIQKTGVSDESPSPVAFGCSIAPRPDAIRRLISGCGSRSRSLGRSGRFLPPHHRSRPVIGGPGPASGARCDAVAKPFRHHAKSFNRLDVRYRPCATLSNPSTSRRGRCSRLRASWSAVDDYGAVRAQLVAGKGCRCTDHVPSVDGLD